MVILGDAAVPTGCQSGDGGMECLLPDECNGSVQCRRSSVGPGTEVGAGGALSVVAASEEFRRPSTGGAIPLKCDTWDPVPTDCRTIEALPGSDGERWASPMTAAIVAPGWSRC